MSSYEGIPTGVVPRVAPTLSNRVAEDWHKGRDEAFKNRTLHIPALDGQSDSWWDGWLDVMAERLPDEAYNSLWGEVMRMREAHVNKVAEQPAPIPNDHPAVWPLVMVDMATRDKTGRERYGVPLQPHNGRDALRDAYEEALDLAVYLRSAIYERDGR